MLYLIPHRHLNFLTQSFPAFPPRPMHQPPPRGKSVFSTKVAQIEVLSDGYAQSIVMESVFENDSALYAHHEGEIIALPRTKCFLSHHKSVGMRSTRAEFYMHSERHIYKSPLILSLIVKWSLWELGLLEFGAKCTSCCPVDRTLCFLGVQYTLRNIWHRERCAHHTTTVLSGRLQEFKFVFGIVNFADKI